MLYSGRRDLKAKYDFFYFLNIQSKKDMLIKLMNWLICRSIISLVPFIQLFFFSELFLDSFCMLYNYFLSH